MKKNLLAVLLIVYILSVSTFANEIDEYPVDALELFAETKVEKCNICIKGLIRDAIEEFDDYYKKKNKFKTKKTNLIIKTKDCRKNEFTLESVKLRKTYKKDPEKGKIYLPKVSFRIHTSENNLIGINKKYYTDKKLADQLNLAKINKIYFQAEYEIIPYKYGDGKNIIYFQKEDKVQIQCRLISLKKIKK